MKKEKIIGSDAKIFFNDDKMKEDPRNNPRIFANSVAISDEGASVQKGFLPTALLEKMKNVRLGN